MLLAYYVAAVNIEETFHGLVKDTGGAHAESYGVDGYEPFPGIVLTDTFQSSEDDDRYDDGGIFGDNNERVKTQNALDIRVIVGNPPYSSGQDSANDNNQNLKYPFPDARIAATYAAKSTAQNKNSLYDSYIRAIRWASDRIKDRGVVAFVSNGGFLDGNTADGLRKSLAEEFSSLYIFNLRGNTRTSGEQARKEGGQTFGSGSRATIAISVLVKNPDATEHGLLHYRDIGDYLTREQKLSLVAEYGSIAGVPWMPVTPNSAGDWLNQRDDTFGRFTPIFQEKSVTGVFASRSPGLQTNRDAWVYNASRAKLEGNVERTIDVYNAERRRWNEANADVPLGTFLDSDSTHISWTSGLLARVQRDQAIAFNPDQIAVAVYRPFCKQFVYFDADLIHRRGTIPKMFPTAALPNLGIVITSPASHYAFTPYIVECLPDLHTLDTGQFFPRYTYETRGGDTELDIFGDSETYTRVDNVTDEIIAEYRELYGAEVTEDDVFFFIYGLLHSPDYRMTYASDLKKMLPRIPKLEDASDFRAFSDAGRKLSELHIGYESADTFPLEMVTARPGTVPDLRVTKMRFAGKAGAWDKSTIRYNDEITLTGIPDEAHDYMLGSRSAIEWIIERYRVKTDKDSGIVNDPNDWAAEHDDPEYILNLVKRIVTVSVETVAIVKALPALRILDTSEVASEVVAV